MFISPLPEQPAKEISKAQQLQLDIIAKTEQFNEDEIHWIGGESAGDMLGTSEVDDKSYVILAAWWD